MISGLPGSGKSTLAHLLGEELGFPVIDKDDFLEGLLGSATEFDAEFRSKSSREADKHLETAVRAAGDAILVSHWRRPGDLLESGTPTEWLGEFDGVIEIVCRCSAMTAVHRFTNRNRHPGHGDATKDTTELLQWFENDSLKGPLGIGSLITVDTETVVDIKKLALECRQLA